MLMYSHGFPVLHNRNMLDYEEGSSPVNGKMNKREGQDF